MGSRSRPRRLEALASKNPTPPMVTAAATSRFDRRREPSTVCSSTAPAVGVELGADAWEEAMAGRGLGAILAGQGRGRANPPGSAILIGMVDAPSSRVSQAPEQAPEPGHGLFSSTPSLDPLQERELELEQLKNTVQALRAQLEQQEQLAAERQAMAVADSLEEARQLRSAVDHLRQTLEEQQLQARQDSLRAISEEQEQTRQLQASVDALRRELEQQRVDGDQRLEHQQAEWRLQQQQLEAAVDRMRLQLEQAEADHRAALQKREAEALGERRLLENTVNSMRRELEQAASEHEAALRQRETELEGRLRELQEALVQQRQLLESVSPDRSGGPT